MMASGFDGPRVGVVDIGSNSIRLVVFDRLCRAPVPIFNEKVLCGLARGLERDGRLNAIGVEQALVNLTRFRRLADRMGVGRLDVLATAAVRDAEDGADFVAAVQSQIGLDVTVISGRREAELAGFGVLSGMPEADGLVGDLGGGSLELVGVRDGTVTPFVTLPLGHLRLADQHFRDRRAVTDAIEQHLARQSFLKKYTHRSLIMVGGAWRALARLHMLETGYPLQVLQRYTVDPERAEAFCERIALMDKVALDRIVPGSGRRNESLPTAATVLHSLIRHQRPSSVVVSAYGLREGHLLALLPDAERAADPLLTACSELMTQLGRFGNGTTLYDWSSALFLGEDTRARRLRHAACILSDLGWMEHPDYRAEHAFLRALRMPFPGIDHLERAFLALAVYIRYSGQLEDSCTASARSLLTEGQRIKVTVLGRALRLGQTLSGGLSSLLTDTKLRMNGTKLLLEVSTASLPLLGEVPRRRLKALAEALNREFEIVVPTDAPMRWPHVVVD